MVNWSEKERAAWRVAEPAPIAVWALENVYLTTEMGVTSPGYYDVSVTPWCGEIFEALADKNIENVVWVKSAQIGGSLTVQIYILWIIDNDPSNILYFMDTDGNAKWASRYRLQKVMNSAESLKAKVDPPRKRATFEINYDGGVLNLAGANSVSQLSSKSAPVVIRDETGKWREKLGAEAGALELAGERVAGQYYYKLVDISTPVIEGDPILKQYAISDQRRYLVPCPVCGGYQELIWEQVKWAKDDQGKSVAPEAARKDTWYECVKCGGEIREKSKRWMVGNGKWVKKGETVVERLWLKVEGLGKVEGRRSKVGSRESRVESREWEVRLPAGEVKYYRIEGTAERAGKVAGFHISRLYSPFKTWGQLAEEWLNIGADLSKRQTFFNATLALPWRVRTLKVDAEKLGGHIWAALPPGVIPAGYDYVAAGADVQQKEVYYEVWAFNEEGASHLVEYGQLGRIEELAAVASSTYEREGHGGEGEEGERLGIRLMLVDSRYRTTEVENFCRRHGNIFPCKGLTSRQVPRTGPVGPSTIRTDSKGRRLPPNLWRRYYHVHTATFKDELHSRLEIEWDFKGEVPAGFISFHGQTGKDFFDQLTAEERIEKTDIRGRVYYEWLLKSKQNHYLDGRVYAAAAYSYFAGEWGRERRRRDEAARKAAVPKALRRAAAEQKAERRRRRGRGGFLEEMPSL